MLTAIGNVMRECYSRGWITTRDGNCSLRRTLEGKISSYLYLTPKGVRKNEIHPEHIVKIRGMDIGGGNIPEEASTEFYMHYYLQRDITSTQAVLHVHPTHVVAAMYAGWDLQEICKGFPEISRYTKVGPTVPVVPAGSSELASHTNLRFRDGDKENPIIYDIVGQANHGACAVGSHPWDAFEHIERLDHICQIVLASGRIAPLDKT